MRNSLLKTAKFHKLFGETDVWHQRRLPLRRGSMAKARTCLALPLPYFFRDISEKNSILTFLDASLNDIISTSYLPRVRTRGRTFMTDQEHPDSGEEKKELVQSSPAQSQAQEELGQPKEQTGPVRKTLYEVLATLGRRLLQLSLVFIFYMLGNLLSVGIFVVFFFCSMFVYWLSKKFTIPPDVAMACKGLNLIMLACGLVSAGYLLLWNTYNFIMDVRSEQQNRNPE